MKKYSYMFFDLDGTLSDPFEGITRSVARSLLHFGIEVSDRRELGRFIGPPLRDSFPRYYGIPEDRVEEAIAVYREYFSVKGLFENELYDGIEELLCALYESGIRIVLATAKPEVYARRITEHFGIDKYFYRQCGASLDGSRDTKREVIAYALRECDADPSDVLMVGDRSHDIIGARECGVSAIGVLWGYGDREELEQAGAVGIFSSVSELFAWARENIIDQMSKYSL